MPAPDSLRPRLEEVGKRLGAREATHTGELAEARRRAEALHALVIDALAGFHAGARTAGAPHLAVEVTDPHLDEKHVRSVEFGLQRGRFRAIVTAKSRGEISLVGPFQTGKTEGPCQSFPFEAESELREALGDFLERFLEAATTP